MEHNLLDQNKFCNDFLQQTGSILFHIEFFPDYVVLSSKASIEISLYVSYQGYGYLSGYFYTLGPCELGLNKECDDF